MARVAKYAASAVGHLIAHYERRQKLNKETGEMEYIRFGNRDIDTRWTPLNYRVWPPLPMEDTKIRGIYVSQDLENMFGATGQDSEEPALARFRRIFRDTPHVTRKDLKCFCDWTISLPDEISCDRMGRFFDLCMRYCVRKYGAENVVGGWVHVDEAHRPHLHVAFVPVVGTGENRRICAKDVLNRKHLSDWHGGLTAMVKAAMPDIGNPGILNGRTAAQGGNRTVKQMKASDKAYDRSKGKEVDAWRVKAEKSFHEAVKRQKTGTLDNMMVAAGERVSAQLKEPRKPSLMERLKGR